jgi:hypothetical protein
MQVQAKNTAESIPSTSPRRRCNQEQSTFSIRCILELILWARCMKSGNYRHGSGMRIIGRVVVEEYRAFDGENFERCTVYAYAACPTYELLALITIIPYAKHYMLS